MFVGHEMNHRLQKLEELEKAQVLWKESERILGVLRTKSCKPLKEATEDELVAWHRKLQQNYSPTDTIK